MTAVWIYGIYVTGGILILLFATNADVIRRPNGVSTGENDGLSHVGDAGETMPGWQTDVDTANPPLARDTVDDGGSQVQDAGDAVTGAGEKTHDVEDSHTTVVRGSVDNRDKLPNKDDSATTATDRTPVLRGGVSGNKMEPDHGDTEGTDAGEKTSHVADCKDTDAAGTLVARGKYDDDTTERAASGAEFFNNVRRNVRDFLSGMRTFGTSSLEEVKEKLVDDMGQHLGDVINRVLGTGRSAAAGGSDSSGNGFNVTGMPVSDVMRMIRDISQLPEALQEKLSELHGLAMMSLEELREFPASALPSFIAERFEDFRNFSRQKTAAICERLVDESCSPTVLRSAFLGGLDCTTALDIMRKAKHLFSTAQSRLMMAHLRATSREPVSWNSSFITAVVATVGTALTEKDILALPKEAFRESLANISTVRLPDKSQRKAIIKKLVVEFMTPTAWPEQLLRDMGRMVEDMDLTQIVYLRGSKVTAAADALRKTNIVSGLARTAIAKNVYNGLWSRIEDLDENGIALALPWLKCDKKFVVKLNLTTLLAALNSSGMADVQYTDSEATQISDRLRMSTLFNVVENITTELFDGIGPAMRGMPKSLFASLPIDVIKNSQMLPNTDMSSTAKARQIMTRMRTANQSLEVYGSTFGALFKGLNVDDINNMPENALEDNLQIISRLNLDTALSRAVIKKLEAVSQREFYKLRFYIRSRAREPCSNLLHQLGNLVPHIPCRVLRDIQLIPGGITTTDDCNVDLEDVKITKAQALAILDNVKDEVGSPGDETSGFDAKLIRRLGRCTIGLTDSDIRDLPIDSELFTIFELLSKYEDELDASQVQSVITKIREAFNIENRNVITEVTDVTISQIGRFLQYLNDEYELPRFPKELRPLIAKEMGRSKMNKITTGKRRRLLQFALKNTNNGNGVLVDMTRAAYLNEATLMDLGHLKCGMEIGHIRKLSAGALEQSIEELQLCPFGAEASEELVKRSLAYNTNTVKLRERLAALGPMGQHLTSTDMSNINKEELSTVAEYIVTRMDERDDELDIRYYNGFIREMAVEKRHRDQESGDVHKKQFLTKLHESLQEASSDQGEVKCHNMLALRSRAAMLGAVPFASIEPCLDDIGNLHTWSSDDARAMLSSMCIAKYGQGINPDSLSQWDDELIREVGGFIKGLRPDEIERLPLANIQVMATIGNQRGYSMEQVKSGFKRWKHLRDQTNTGTVSADELASLGEFACGATTDFIQSQLQSDVVLDSVNALGELTSCSPDQLSALVGRLADQLGNDVATWSLSSIAEIRKIIGGFNKDQIRRLKRHQLSVISPATISTMPPENIKEFTAEQLADFTDNQANAITSMQRSYMDDGQMAALGDFGLNGGDTTQRIDIGNIVWLFVFSFLLYGT